MPDIFLSYSREDLLTARRFAEGLMRAGFSVWWDQALNPGEAFDQVTEKALEEAKAVIVLWSRTSVNSRWVRAEATQAHADNRLVPVMIEPCKRPIMFELTHTAELAHWKGTDEDPQWQSFIASLRKITGSVASSPPVATGPADAGASRRMPRRRFVRLAAAILAAVVIAAGMLLALHGKRPAAVDSVADSIVVLPFDDVSPDRNQAYYGDGVAGAIRESLDGIPGLTVTPRTSSVAAKVVAGDPRKLGKLLGVARMLEGTASTDGKQLHISVQLVDTDSGKGLWSQTYDRPTADIFDVQKEIATRVAQALQVTLGVGIGQQPGMTRDAEAYENYLEAMALRGSFTPESWRRGLELLDRAEGRDQQFVLAWFATMDLAANMPILLGVNAVPAELQSWEKKRAAALERLRQITKGTPESLLLFAPRDASPKEAAARFQAAAAGAAKLGRNRAGDDRGGSSFLLAMGRTREALGLLEQAKLRDPLNPEVAIELAMAYSRLGNPQAAFAEVERGNMLDARNVNITGRAVAIALGAHDSVQLQRWLDATQALITDPATRGFTERIRQLLDKPVEARAYLRQWARSADATPLSIGVISLYMAYFGDAKGALDTMLMLPKASVFSVVDPWAPVMQEVRALPEFKQLFRDAGLVDYWRAYGWADLCKITTGDDFECH